MRAKAMMGPVFITMGSAMEQKFQLYFSILRAKITHGNANSPQREKKIDPAFTAKLRCLPGGELPKFVELGSQKKARFLVKFLPRQACA